jgi:transposase-like protein
MAKTSIASEAGQEGSLREGLEAAIRERVREVIELILEEEVEAALGAGRSQRVAERCGYRHGRKPRRLTLRTGAVQRRQAGMAQSACAAVPAEQRGSRRA